MTNLKQVVLAFSGGLDTTYCAVLLQQQGWQVHAVCVDTGGFSSQDLEAIAQRAQQAGVAHFQVLDHTQQFYEQGLRYLLCGHMRRGGAYPLCVSAERVFQAHAIAHYAQQAGAAAVAHGSTGAGNDQLRFDMMFHVLLPGVQIITPIRDGKLSRAEEIDFLKAHGISFPYEKAKYSINKGLWGTTVGGAETLTSHLALPEEAWPSPLTAHHPADLSITFEKGEPVALNGEAMDPVPLISRLNALGGSYGIGRGVHVGDTTIGIKGRVAFEAPAAHLLVEAHHLLEKHTLTKWQAHWKDQLAAWYGNQLHEGHYLEPTMRHIESFLLQTQERVSGTVTLRLHPLHAQMLGCESPYDLLSSKAGQYGEMNNAWTAEDAKGFARLLANGISIYHQQAPTPSIQHAQ